jgi:hypothetical protein
LVLLPESVASIAAWLQNGFDAAVYLPCACLEVDGHAIS